MSIESKIMLGIIGGTVAYIGGVVGKAFFQCRKVSKLIDETVAVLYAIEQDAKSRRIGYDEGMKAVYNAVAKLQLKAKATNDFNDMTKFIDDHGIHTQKMIKLYYGVR